ncbi:MAG: ABC transporter ATP-binding protein [Deltaproteobacteria bacterium]|nr:ABC transporter ATP-binding protein [Deltaproteobacteria bacterium]
MTAMPVLEARDLSVGRGATAVLSAIDLAIAAGEHLALVGANGSGKTTLLRALAGLDRPRAGEIRWSGGPLPRGSARVRAIGVLFQTEPPSRFTVRELVTLGLALDGPADAHARARVETAIADGGLTALADRPCATLSGGEAQRAVLARALVAGPRVLLLDEPTNHLDPARQAALHAWLDRRAPHAVVLATHDLALAARCDRVALLHGGRIAAVGAPHDMLTPPHLATTLGVRVRRLDDPEGGPPLLRIIAPVPEAA